MAERPRSRQNLFHRWDLSPQEAIDLQRQLAAQVIRDQPMPIPRRAAGLDVAFGPKRQQVYAAIVVYELPDLQLVDRAAAVCPVTFPYVPGLLSFREAPALLEAFDKLAVKPDCLLVDGHGYAHPRRFGLACHIGLLLGLPSVGCAKSVLVGECDEPGQERGAWTPLVDRGEVVGAALRTRSRVKPVYVSVGHLTDLNSAIQIVLAFSSGRYRLPEPLRAADQLSRQLARAGTPELVARVSQVVRTRRSKPLRKR